MARMKDPEIEIDGVTYQMRLGTITRTMLGYEDHGIFTAMLTFDFGGSGQGAGGYCLDRPKRDGESRRMGTAYGLDHIIAILDTVAVSSWEELKGRTAYALRADDYGLIQGLAHPFKPETKHLIFKAHAEQWEAKEESRG